jgi:hypothetical protein
MSICDNTPFSLCWCGAGGHENRSNHGFQISVYP